ncbi:MAG: hypothetical protein EOP83_08075, partial [Verrucomicrobiaceae bacterium]
MNHPLLDPHDTIAWDMDGTLIDGPNSEFFRAYILAHPEKHHHIVTFRTGPSRRFPDNASALWKDDAIHELLEHGVALDVFKATHGIPEELYSAWASRKTLLSEAEVAAYVMWKGKMAAEIGATVMVDDMPGMVKKGCKAHGVVFIDANLET